MQRALIKFKADCRYGDYKKGEQGHIDGYIRGGNDVPQVVVIKDNGDLVLAEIYHIEVLDFH